MQPQSFPANEQSPLHHGEITRTPIQSPEEYFDRQREELAIAEQTEQVKAIAGEAFKSYVDQGITELENFAQRAERSRDHLPEMSEPKRIGAIGVLLAEVRTRKITNTQDDFTLAA